MIGSVELSDRLKQNPDQIIKVLIALGFPEDKIVFYEKKGLITSTRPDPESDNPKAFLLYTDSLRYMFTTRKGEGNLFNLVMEMKKVNFPSALELIAKWIEFEPTKKMNIVRPFGGFYKNLIQREDIVDTELDTYDESSLPLQNSVSSMFFKDGISYQTQERFGVRIDHEENAVLIPVRNIMGELVGCKARRNERKPKDGIRYWAKLPFQKTHVLYGINNTCESILSKDTIIVFEAEKSVQQAWSFGCCVGVATMGCQISKSQVRMIKSLMTKRIILAFDEGLSEKEIKEQAEKLVTDCSFFKNQVWYIYGGMERGSKNSPTDNGKSVFQRLLKENIKRIF